jgi:hypothetical protein
MFGSLHRTDSRENVFDLRPLPAVCVGGRYPLTNLSNVDQFHDKIAPWTIQFEGYKEIRGDGNCYYRAVVFGALELVLQSPQRAVLMRQWINLFSAIDFGDEECVVKKRHSTLLNTFKQAAGS